MFIVCYRYGVSRRESGGGCGGGKKQKASLLGGLAVGF